MRDVTIIIPAYVTDDQSLGWLYECVQSALNQDCQVVVYDDCSRLDIEKLKSDFNNVGNLRVFKGTSHKGVSYARNRAVEYATTNLILPLDCDDILADGTVEKLLNLWSGTPVYPDLSKFGITEVPHYRLLDFSCDLLQKKLGISSVNVLHSVDQWRSVGGWDEHLDLYEDADYNAKLMLMYCGMNLHEPLVRYRQHDSQRTRRIKDTNISVDIARDILNGLRRLTVGCPSCGGKRRSASSAVVKQVAPVAPESLPGTQDGRVLALYIGGKGQATHYYRGVSTKFAYKVKYGEYYYVDPSDATGSQTPGRRSLFVLVEKPATVVKVEEQKLQEVVVRTPVQDTVRTPVVDVPTVGTSAVEDNLPDVANMSYNDLKNVELDEDGLSKLLVREESGRGRKGIINYLKKRIQS
jgi:hypothetical protein